MPFRLKKSVVLVGMMGAGKTAIGTALARRLGVRFLDSDAEIETAANMTIAEIFDRDGEPFFRDKESQVIERLLHAEPGVLSTGGGAFLKVGNREMISRDGVSVWLRAELDLLWARVRHKSNRPLLRSGDPFGSLTTIYHARQPDYAKADLVVDADAAFSIDDMTERVVTALLTRADVLEVNG